MKKNLFFALAAVALASCTQDEILVLNQEPIGFSNSYVDNATRAIDQSYSKSNLPGTFHVYGTTKGDEADAQLVPLYKHVTVTNQNTSDDAWVGQDYKYDPAYTQYWIDGNSYNFAALIHAEANEVTLDEYYLPQTVTFTSDTQTDLLYARSANNIIGKASGNEQVAFTFEHLLAKVYVTFKNTITTNSDKVKYEYKVTNVHIDNAIEKGQCNIATKKWSGHSSSIKVNFGNITDKTDISDINNTTAIAVGAIGAVSSATSHYARLLIPGIYDGAESNPQVMDLLFTVETLINGQSVDIRYHKVQANVTLEAGHAYNFIIEKGAPGEKIMFTVEKDTSVKDWDTTNND